MNTRPRYPLTFDRQLPAGAVVLGATVTTLAADGVEGEGERWTELAYSVSMAGSEVTLAKEDFDRCVENFQRYPCVPVVIEHADTSWDPEPEWAEPHGYVEALRVGEREVTELDGTKRMAATLEGRVSYLPDTAAEVKARKWRFGSITIIKGAVDEATGAALGALLWSWSLTAHPRLTNLPPIAASRRPPESTRGTTAVTTENTMPKFLELAAKFGLTATSEDDARDKILALLALGADALKGLGLSLGASPADVAARVKELTSLAARVPAMETELTAFRANEAKAAEALRTAWLDDLVAARPELGTVRASLALHAERDWTGFQASYPRPTRETLITAAAEQAQRAQDPARTQPVAVTAASPATKDAPKPTDAPKIDRKAIGDVLDEFGLPSDALSVTQALAQGYAPATLRAALEQRTR